MGNLEEMLKVLPAFIHPASTSMQSRPLEFHYYTVKPGIQEYDVHYDLLFLLLL